VQANAVFKKWAVHFFGERSNRKFRIHYFSNTWTDKRQIPDADRALIDNVREIATSYVLPGYVLIATTEVKRGMNLYNRHAGQEDLFQLACEAILEACYGYNGSVKLSTYLTTAIKHRLADEFKSSKRRRDTVLRSEIEYEDGSVYNEAIDETDPQVDRRKELALQAIEAVARDDFDKALVEAYLKNVQGFQSAVAADFHVTRAAAQQRWANMQKRLRLSFARLEQDAA
jgi:RNA polymerase sigma factor (sigma-70 family)